MTNIKQSSAKQNNATQKHTKRKKTICFSARLKQVCESQCLSNHPFVVGVRLVSNLLEEDGDTVVLDDSGAISHVKVVASDFDFETGLEASEAAQAEAESVESSLTAGLQTRLDVLEPGSSVDRSTPKDGHCLSGFEFSPDLIVDV